MAPGCSIYSSDIFDYTPSSKYAPRPVVTLPASVCASKTELSGRVVEKTDMIAPSALPPGNSSNARTSALGRPSAKNDRSAKYRPGESVLSGVNLPLNRPTDRWSVDSTGRIAFLTIEDPPYTLINPATVGWIDLPPGTHFAKTDTFSPI